LDQPGIHAALITFESRDERELEMAKSLLHKSCTFIRITVVQTLYPVVLLVMILLLQLLTWSTLQLFHKQLSTGIRVPLQEDRS
jgi:hypothetical protein